ncbi:MAG: PHP domain-containing protein [Desulfobacteraceae bacterium]
MDSKQSGGIDLHIHSTASDGTYTPREIIEMAVNAGLRAISITDHDTLEGCRTAYNGDIPSDLGFITGVEISVQAPENSHIRGSLHILGYGVDPENRPLCLALEKYQDIRKHRIFRTVERLQKLGFPIKAQQVMDQAGDGVAGRPHVAEVMVKAGYADNINDAFDRYLGNGRPACVGKERMDCRDAFHLIAGAGGIPVLAHPYLVSDAQSEGLVQLLEQLRDMGLKGIEVYYPKHSQAATARYLELAASFGLAATGGTDFHGELIPDIKLGRGSGDLHVPYAIFEELLSRYSITFAR